MLIVRKMILIAGLVVFALTSTVTTAVAGSVSQGQMLKAVNALRQQHRLPLLKLHPSLQKAADEQARLMAKKRKMSHKVGWGHGFRARLKRAGYRGLAAENIALGQETLGQVLSAWMNSRGHRRNMLHPRMRFFGLAANRGGGRKFWAMVLGG